MLRLLIFSTLAAATCPPDPSANAVPCPSQQHACGSGCIPQDAVCCNGGAGASSYCTNAAGSPCRSNATGACLSTTVGKGKADYCCATNSDVGSNDCDPGSHHCGLSCRPEAESCCSRASDFCTAATGGGGGGGAGGGAGTGGGAGASSGTGGGSANTCYLLGAGTCTTSSKCCDGLTTGDPGFSGSCTCLYQPGQRCYGGGNISFYRFTECCNAKGPNFAEGVVKSSCGTPAVCTSDSHCPAGKRCDPTWDCQQVCGTVGWDVNPTVPCCGDLVAGTSGNNKGYCSVPSGKLCFTNGDCASNKCVAGATGATCE